MKSEADLSLLARQWGATAVPFGLVNGQDWLETPDAQKALDGANPNGGAAFGPALERPQRRGQKRPGGRWMRS